MDFSLHTIDHLTDNIADTYIPMKDLEDIVDSWNPVKSFLTLEQIVTISLECEQIMLCIMKMITFLMKRSNYEWCNNILKHYYNKLSRLDFKYGNLHRMPPLSEETIKNNKIEKIEDIVISIINSIAELHTIVVKSSNVKIDLLNISIYCGSLKKNWILYVRNNFHIKNRHKNSKSCTPSGRYA